MASANVGSTHDVGGAPLSSSSYPGQVPISASAVSWGAIIAGAAAAAALSLILLILGTGLGLSSVSPWTQSGMSAAAFGVSTVVWVTLTQVIASGLGGYLAGRLRTKWLSTHSDEVYFRDTAHGFLAWAVASLATAALLGSVIGSIVSGSIQAGASVAGGVANAATSAASAGAAASADASGKAASESNPMGYFIDSMFRKDNAVSTGTGTGEISTAFAGNQSAEISRIFVATMRSGALPPEDSRYIAQVVAQRTGVSQADAEKRVNDTFARLQAAARNAEATAKDVADKARKASSYAALWLFISLLMGAFTASLAATYGGRQRDL